MVKMKNANNWHIDGMILGTFLSTIFFSATYPYIHKCIVMQIPDYFLAVNQVINCGGVIIWGTLWNRKSNFLFSNYVWICILETILGIATTGFAIICGNIYINFYTVLDFFPWQIKRLILNWKYGLKNCINTRNRRAPLEGNY